MRSLLLSMVLLIGCTAVPVPVDVHILPADNYGCEITCKDGLCIIKCVFKNSCKPEGEATCVVENGQMRIRPSCCPMYVVRRACGCLKNGTYKGYFKNGSCDFRILITR